MSEEALPTLKLSEMKEAYPHRVLVEGYGVLVIKNGNEVHAISELCPHAMASMYNGDVDGDEIICPIHGARFSIKTGSALMGPTSTPLSCYNVTVEGDSVTIGPKKERTDDPFSQFKF